ncbi:MAG: aminotransferase class I/II-fold pyridoxal phosphate-dependent enzyme [Planctomycetota bacterium]
MAVSTKLAPFGTTIFSEMTRLAIQHGAVNLAQGFPDFDGPEIAKKAGIDAINAGHSQYARMLGVPLLNKAIGDAWTRRTGFHVDPDTHITVTSGCTEAIAATLLGLLSPGDEAVIFEPFYDSYRACVALAGATARYVTLRPDKGNGFGFDEAELRAAFTDKTRMVLLNTPHNPTGKVFTAAELSLIAELCVKHNALVMCDEVYEHLTYDPTLPHISIATLPGMAGRTVTLGSVGKSYNLTGWKVGWAIAWPELTAGVRAAHQFLTFATATPMQHGAAAIINNGEETISKTRAMFIANRDKLAEALSEIGFHVFRSDGTYFLMVDHTPVSRGLGLGGDVDDQVFCRWLTEHAKVAAIPPSVFYNTPANGRSFARFAFCKKPDTIDEAIRRLRKLTR